MCERKCAMTPKQQCVDVGFIIPITKEEKKISTQKDFATVSERLENERTMPMETFMRPMERPKKELQAMLLKLKVELMKPTTKKS